MKLKAVVLIFAYLSCHYSIAQAPIHAINKLENIADSIYFNKSESYTTEDYETLIALRRQIISKHKDTSSTRYKTALFKKQAAEAIVHQYGLRYDDAILASKKALNTYEKYHINDKYFKGHVVKYLYKQHYYDLDYEKALERAKETKTIFKDTLVYNHRLIAQAEFNIGRLLNQFEDFSKVIAQYKKAIDLNISNQGELNSDVAYQKHHLALVYGFVGYYKKELDTYLDVIRIWESIESEDKSYLNIAYGSLNTWYRQHGDYDKAEEYVIKSENLIKSDQTNLSKWFNETYRGRTQVNLWNHYANLYLLKKDTAKAITYNNKISAYFYDYDDNDQRNNPKNLSYYKNFINIGRIGALRFKGNLLKNKNPKEAKIIYEKILTLLEKDAGSLFFLNEQLGLIDLYLNEKAFKKAELSVLNWTKNCSETKDNYYLMLLRGEQAHIAFVQDSFDEMHKYYISAFKDLPIDTTTSISIKDLDYAACKPYSGHHFISLLIQASKDYSHAFNTTNRKVYLEIAHNLSEIASDAFSDNYLFSEFNEATYETVVQINEELLSTSLLLESETIQHTILEKIEESNSKISWQKFLNSSQRKFINIPDSILNEESDLKNEFHFYKKQLFLNSDTDKDQTLIKEKIFGLQKRVDSLNNWFKENFKSYFNQTRQKFDLNALKERLHPNQRIIKYCFTHKSVYAFVITKSNVKLVKISNKQELNQRLEKTLYLLKNTKDTDYEESLQQLYTKLLPQTVLESENHQDLIFVLDDLLYYFPFEILMPANGQYLVENHSISYAASLLLWEEQLKAEKSKNNKLGIYAPTYIDERNDSNNSELIGAAFEATQISNLLNSDVYLGKAASKATFLATANKYSILHLAMHSSINTINSEFSNLSFGASEAEKLFISELYNLSLTADLAVLSACDTGVGNLKKGEGLINVSKAFTYAGVPSTITSLWKVPDKETAQIMESFYKHLKAGAPKNRALQLAKLDYVNTVEDSFLKHPFYWAGFVLSGDISPVSSGNNYWWLLLLSFPFLLLIFRKTLRKRD